MASILHEGVEFAVTDGWDAANSQSWPELAKMDRAQIDGERKRILALSEDRRLTSEERSYLKTLDNHYNVRNALKVLGINDPSHPAFEFMGADQLHGNRITFDCGCQLNVIFDHHQAMAVAAASEVVNHIETLKTVEDDPQVAAIIKPKIDAATIAFEAHAELARLDPDPHAVAQIEVPFQPHTPRYVCDDHAHIEDLHELHATVAADNAKMEADEAPQVK